MAEVYSPPRVTAAAKLLPELKLIPGFALDLTTNDVDGRAWNFAEKEMRERAMAKLKAEEPQLLVGSPMCTAFSQLQAINVARRDPAIVRRELESAKDHVRWVMKLCALQVRENRYFLFEHPKTATSWKMAEVERVSRMDGVGVVTTHMCAFGMLSKDEDGVELVKKPTSMMTNSPEVGRRLAKRGCNHDCPEEQQHRHVKLINGRASHAQVYPRALTSATAPPAGRRSGRAGSTSTRATRRR